jgi:hypothetical protein
MAISPARTLNTPTSTFISGAALLVVVGKDDDVVAGLMAGLVGGDVGVIKEVLALEIEEVVLTTIGVVLAAEVVSESNGVVSVTNVIVPVTDAVISDNVASVMVLSRSVVVGGSVVIGWSLKVVGITIQSFRSQTGAGGRTLW